MSGIELDREFKALLAAVRPLLPSVPQTALASSVRWLQKLSSLPATQRCLRNQHLRLLHEQLAAGAIAPPFDSEPPQAALSALPSGSAGANKRPTEMRACVQPPQLCGKRCEASQPTAAGDSSPTHSDAKSLIDEARAMLRNARKVEAPRRKARLGGNAAAATVLTLNLPNNDDEWSDVSTTSAERESCASGDFPLTLLAGTGHERCILLHRKHLLQLANQSARIRRYEAALKHFLDNPALLLGDQAGRAGSALEQQLAAAKKQLAEAEREKSESQKSARETSEQLHACQQLIKCDSENFARQLAALNGKLQAYQMQMRAEADAAADRLAALNVELKTCQMRMRGDAESFREQLAALNVEMQEAEEEAKRQLAARDKKARLQLTALREQMQHEFEDKLDAAKRKISRLHKVIRRYDELKQRWGEEFEKKIHRLQIEKDLQMAKVRLEMQSERATCLIAGSGDQMVAELEIKYQDLARKHEEASWRQRQRDLRRISELERELEAKSMQAT